MVLGANGTLFVGIRTAGKVYALPARGEKTGEVFVLIEGLIKSG